MKNLFVIGVLSVIVGLIVIIISLAALGGLFTWAGILGIILLIIGIGIIRNEKNRTSQQSAPAAAPEETQSEPAPSSSSAAQSGRPELTFYDVKLKKKFNSSEYDIRKKSNRYFAVTQSPSGDYECWKIISNKKARELST